MKLFDGKEFFSEETKRMAENEKQSECYKTNQTRTWIQVVEQRLSGWTCTAAWRTAANPCSTSEQPPKARAYLGQHLAQTERERHITRKTQMNEILGWPKSLFVFFCTMLRKTRTNFSANPI